MKLSVTFLIMKDWALTPSLATSPSLSQLTEWTVCWGQSRSGEHVVANLLFPVTASLTLSLGNLQPLPHHDSLFFLGKSLVTWLFVSQMWEPGTCNRDCFHGSQLYTRFSFTINILAALWLCVRYNILDTRHLHCFWLAARSNIPNRKHHPWRPPLFALCSKEWW